MNIKQILIWANKTLHQIDPQHHESAILLSFCLNKPKEYLFTHPHQVITATQWLRFKKLINRRLKKEPIAYLINQKEFYGLNFYIDKNVLIPRPETELIIDEVLKITNNRLPITIADIGTGSGCLAITLAKLLPKAKIIATDISLAALRVAKKNAIKHGVSKQIKFIKSNLFSSFVIRHSSFEIIIANLPYLTKNELKNVPYEPRQALYGGKDGLEIIEKFLKQVKNFLKPNGIIFLEISPTQVTKIKKLVKKYLPGKKIRFIKDLRNKKRIIEIK